MLLHFLLFLHLPNLFARLESSPKTERKLVFVPFGTIRMNYIPKICQDKIEKIKISSQR